MVTKTGFSTLFLFNVSSKTNQPRKHRSECFCSTESRGNDVRGSSKDAVCEIKMFLSHEMPYEAGRSHSDRNKRQTKANCKWSKEKLICEVVLCCTCV